MKNRVVVTGIGAVSPFGIGVETLWKHLLIGKSKIQLLDLELDQKMYTPYGASLKEFSFGEHFPLADRYAGYMDRAIEFVLVATKGACDQANYFAGIEQKIINPSRVGYIAALLFIITISSLGIIVANFSQTMQQTTFVIFFFAIVMLLMSGIFTPIESMPYWAQASTYANPLRYFCSIMRDLYLKKPTVGLLCSDLITMLVFSTISFLLALATYRKR